jgi:hypothetical protein
MSSRYEPSFDHGGQESCTFTYATSHNNIASMSSTTIHDTPVPPSVAYSYIGGYGDDYGAQQAVTEIYRPVYVSFSWNYSDMPLFDTIRFLSSST